jgi:membrane protein involved in colicin uptake
VLTRRAEAVTTGAILHRILLAILTVAVNFTTLRGVAGEDMRNSTVVYALHPGAIIAN